MEGYIDIRKLNLDELVAVVSLYPWFGAARMELCSRMAAMGEELMSEDQFADAAMYLPSRRKIADKIRDARASVLTDDAVEDIIKSYVAQKEAETAKKPKRRVYAGAGDYFSQEEYDQARHDEDNVFSKYAAKARKERPIRLETEPSFEFFTETLAQIYVEQGYYEHAKEIYSKLILAYPEKNAYFAALIEKLDELN